MTARPIWNKVARPTNPRPPMRPDHPRRAVRQNDGGDEPADMTLYLTRLIWAGFFFALAIFAKLPGLDLLVSANYYNAEAGFFHRDAPMVRALYDWTPILGRALVVILLLFALGAPLISRMLARHGKAEMAQRCKGPLRHAAVVAVCCALLGPGLVIEGVLKNTVGRPRPVQVEQFGGTQV